MSSRIEVGSFFGGGIDAATDAVVARAQEGKGGYACLANVHVVVTADANPELRAALCDAWTVFPDGWPVAWLQRRTGLRQARRVPGPDLMPRVIDRGRDAGLRHFLFGTTESVLRQLESELLRSYPGAEIVGLLAPGFWDGPNPAAISAIRAARPHIVWCALGAPKQELWMRAHSAALAPSLLLGVGAAFDFLSQNKRRAPFWVRGVGLEWLHRLASEPRRLGPRYVRTNASFLITLVGLLGRRARLLGLTAVRHDLRNGDHKPGNDCIRGTAAQLDVPVERRSAG